MRRILPIMPLMACCALVAAPVPKPQPATSWPCWCGGPHRNNASHSAKNILDSFDPETGDGILWKANLGSRTYYQPVVGNGLVLVGTNNEQPRNPRDVRLVEGEIEPLDKGIVMAFDAATGQFRWQAVHNKLPAGAVVDWPKEGNPSVAAIDGDRAYYLSNRCEVVCIDLNGFANGNDVWTGETYAEKTDADIIWSVDLIKKYKVFPHNASASSPLVIGDIVYVVTGNGVDEGHINIPAPDAPSFIALNKKTGELVWKDNSPGKNIMHGQWSSPAYSEDPVPQIIFPGGDGWLRAFEPKTGKLIWKFNGNTKDAKYELGGTGDKSDFLATPCIHDGRLYIGTGQDPEHFTGTAHLWCLDLKKAVEFGKTNRDNDVSPVNDNFDPAAKVNEKSALAWHYGGPDNRNFALRDFRFGRTMSTVCVVGEVAYVAELHGFVHCFHARTGKLYWSYDTKSAIWGSPLYADGKVFLGTEDGTMFIFRHREKPVQMDIDELVVKAVNKKDANLQRKALRKLLEEEVLIRKIEFDSSIRSTPSVVDNVLYLATEKTLYAIGTKKR
jgi:outer membrane protein assembly factor BamB